MRNRIPAQGLISRGLRPWYAAASALLLMFGFAQTMQAQTNPLNIFQNYFVTGDYVVAGWVEGAPDGSSYAPGLISIPDTRQPSQNGVPATVPTGADIVAAYLYWATVEGNQSSFAGQNGFFNNYPIAGTVLGNPNAPTSWSAGGCSGGAQGSKTMRTYRADVRPYLPLDTNSASPTFGTLLASGSIPVRLADSGSNGNTAPNALGATLVIIYRVLAPVVPLNSIVLYDGAFAPNNSSSSMSQPIVGFYQAAQVPIAKITHIVANGQPNKSETVMLNNVNLPSLYGALPPFPGVYGAWDNPTWLANKYGAAVIANDSAETASVLPAATNSGCVSWGAVIFSSTVQDTDGDGLLDVWETNQGYTDAVSGQLVALPGANKNVKDIFVEVDYLQNLAGQAGNYLHSHLPKQAALDIVGNALAVRNIKVHFDLGQNIYPGDLYVVSSGTGGNAISEGDPLVLCTDGSALCPFPGQPAVGWKGGFALLQNTPTLGNFQPGRAKSYHYVLFGHSLGAPESLWSTAGTALADPTVPQLVSIVNSGTTATVKIQSPQGVVKPGDCPNAALAACSGSNNSRVTVDGALGDRPQLAAQTLAPSPKLLVRSSLYSSFQLRSGPRLNKSRTSSRSTLTRNSRGSSPHTRSAPPSRSLHQLDLRSSPTLSALFLRFAPSLPLLAPHSAPLPSLFARTFHFQPTFPLHVITPHPFLPLSPSAHPALLFAPPTAPLPARSRFLLFPRSAARFPTRVHLLFHCCPSLPFSAPPIPSRFSRRFHHFVRALRRSSAHYRCSPPPLPQLAIRRCSPFPHSQRPSLRRSTSSTRFFLTAFSCPCPSYPPPASSSLFSSSSCFAAALRSHPSRRTSPSTRRSCASTRPLPAPHPPLSPRLQLLERSDHLRFATVSEWDIFFQQPQFEYEQQRHHHHFHHNYRERSKRYIHFQ